MSGVTQSSNLLVGCGHCGETSGTSACECRSQVYCSEACKGLDRERHQERHDLFINVGGKFSSSDFSSWIKINLTSFANAVKSQLELQLPSNRARLPETLVVYVIKLKSPHQDGRNRFSYSETRVFDFKKLLEGPLRISGHDYDLKQFAIDSQPIRAQAKFSPAPERFEVVTVFLCRHRNEGESTYQAAGHFFSFSKRELELWNFNPDPDYEETLRRGLINTAHAMGL